MNVADRFSIALFFAISVHVLLVMFVGFDFELPSPKAKTLEITLVQHKTKASEEADFIAQANQLGSGTEIRKQKLTTTEDARFIADDIYEFGRKSTEKFDVVFTSYGVLCWLPDLNSWAKTIFNSLTTGGEFHLVEFHTFHDLLAGESYFPRSEPDVEDEGTYTENCDGTKSTMVTWSHSLSEVINALISAGFSLEFFKEYAYSPYNCFEGLEYTSGLGYQMLHKGQQVPLLYSIKARKNV